MLPQVYHFVTKGGFSLNVNSLSPYVRLATRSLLGAPFMISRRVLFDYELIFLESGEWELWLDGKTFLCGPGSVLLLRPGQPHSIESYRGQAVSQPHIHFDLWYDSYSEQIPVSFKDLPAFSRVERQWIREDVFKGCGMETPFLKVRDGERFRSLFYGVIDLCGTGGQDRRLAVKAGMLLLLEYLLEENFPQLLQPGPRPVSALQMVRDYIDNNYLNPISLDMLSRQFHYSRYYINREYKKLTGQPVIEYYHSLRVSAAKRLLEEGLSVTETALRLNFHSVYSFSRFFKAKTGLSPTEHRGRGGV